MSDFMLFLLLAAATAVWAAPGIRRRLDLSRAKHPSLRGHVRIARHLARWLPYYGYERTDFFASDGAWPPVAEQREAAFEALGERLRARAPRSLALARSLRAHLSDLDLTDTYRVPFQFRGLVGERLALPGVVEASDGNALRDLDGNWLEDLTGAYGVNLLGHGFYKACVAAGVKRVRDLGPVLGPHHPVVLDNVERLREISGLDEVSFHMSGTEAVMQAVALARFHTGRSHLVRFTGAYHGWWDGVQPGPGNPREVRDVYTLKELDDATLRVLRTRRDIACVLVNPVQALHPNANPPSDGVLVDSTRTARFDRTAYTRWLRTLREVCSERGIVLIIDDVFMGFRLAWGGSQEYFGVRADLVTYGKTLGGGLPVGVVCGRCDLMRRYDPERPARICFARGTFNSHPYVMATMNEFLRRLDDPAERPDYAALDARWSERAAALNARLQAAGVPVRVAQMSSVFTILYTTPGRYNWMLQFYLRDQGLLLSWVGSGRMVFPHVYCDADFARMVDRFVAGTEAMRDDGWWWPGATLSDKAVQRRILRELLAARVRRTHRAAAVGPT